MANEAELIIAIQKLTGELKKSGASSTLSPVNPTGTGRAPGGSEDDVRLMRAKRKLEERSIESLQDFVKGIDKISKTNKLDDILSSTSQTLNNHATALGATFKTTDEEVEFWTKGVGRQLRGYAQALRINQARLKETTVGTEKYAEVQQRIIGLQQQYAGVLEENQNALDDHTDATSQSTKALGALILLGSVFKGLAEDTMMQFKFASQEGLLEMQKFSIFTGVSADVLTQMSSAGRQAFNTMGGAEAVFGMMEDNFMDLVMVTGSYEAAAKLQTDMLINLSQSGIRPSAVAFQESIAQLGRFRKLTGMTSEQYAGMNKRLIESGGIQNKLLALDEKQRKEYMKNTRAQIANRIALGMTEEASIKVAELMAEQAKSPAMKRIEEGAKMAALAGSLQVEGANEIQGLMMRGQRRNAAENERLTEIMANLSAVTTKAGTATLQQELAINAMMESLGISGERIDSFTMLGATARKVEEEALRSTIENGLNPFEKALVDTTTYLGRFAVFAQDKVIAPLAGAAGGILENVLSIGGTVLGLKMGAKALGFGAKAAATTSAASTGAGFMAQHAGKLKFAGKLAGGIGAFAMVGKDLYDLSQGDVSAGNTGALIGSAVGGALGLIGGPLGIALGASIGNMAGEYIGETFFEDKQGEVAQIVDRTMEQATQLAATFESLMQPITSMDQNLQTLVSLGEQNLRVGIEQLQTAVSGNADAKDQLAQINASYDEYKLQGQGA